MSQNKIFFLKQHFYSINNKYNCALVFFGSRILKNFIALKPVDVNI